MSTELELVNKAVADFDAVAEGIQSLKAQYAGVVYDVSTGKGMTEAKGARAAIREPRYAIENTRKAAKAPILALGKRLDGRAAEITDELLAIEEPIDQQIKAEETRKEAERQAKIEAEKKRVADIQDRINELRGTIGAASTSSAALILEHIGDLDRIQIDDSFAEFRQQAEDAKTATLATLAKMYDERVQHEAEQARIKAEREELTRLRAEQEERQRKERAQREAEEAEARRKREAEEAEARKLREQEEGRLRQERAALEAEQERQRQAQAELDRQRADLEAKRQQQEREERTRRDEAARAERLRNMSVQERFGAICWDLAGKRLNDHDLSTRFMSAFARDGLALVKVKAAMQEAA
jgi:hypothetical protein